MWMIDEVKHADIVASEFLEYKSSHLLVVVR